MNNELLIQEVSEFLKLIISEVDKYRTESTAMLVLDGIKEKLPEKHPFSYYLNSEKSYEVTFSVNYHLLKNGKIIKRDPMEVRVPISYDGAYIFNGKFKMPLNYLIRDTEGVIYKDKLILSDEAYIDKKGLRIFNEESNSYDIYLDISKPRVVKEGEKYFRTYGNSEVREVKDIKTAEFQLSTYVKKKLEILYDVNEDSELAELVASVQKLFGSKLRDSMLNHTVMNAELGFLKTLKVAKREILRSMRGKYYNNEKLYATDIQKVIDQYFLGNSTHLHGIQAPTNNNPLNFESYANKLIIESESSKFVPFSKYDLSMLGVVDPIMTPDNMNTSRVNELARGVRITDKIEILVLNKDFEEIYIPLIDYHYYKILKSNFIDYENKSVIEGDWVVKFRLTEVESDTYDYLDANPDFRLSRSSSLVPMINYSDTIRGAMGAKMMNQAIKVKDAESPRIRSGNETLVDNPLITRYSKDSGVVKNVDSEGIEIEIDGKREIIKYPKPIKGYNKSSITFDSLVNPGDKLKKGMPIIKPSSLSKDSELGLGINARVALAYYRGYNFEDGVVVSESFAKRMTSYGVEELTIDIDNSIFLEAYKDSGELIQNFITSSSEKSRREPLMVGMKRKYLEDPASGFRDEIGLPKKSMMRWEYFLPPHITEAYVLDMRIEAGDTKSREETDYILSNRGRASQFDRKFNFNGYDDFDIPEDITNQDILPFKVPKNKGICYRIKYKLLVIDKLKPGDKLTNRFGSKGVVSLVLPDSEMGYDEDGKIVDAYMHPHATLARKNISQIMESQLNAVLDEAYRLNDISISVENYEEVRSRFEKLKMNDFIKMTDEEILNYHETHSYYHYITGSFSRITPKDIIDWMDWLGVDGKIVLFDGKTKKKLRSKVLVSDMYLMKLYFTASNYSKVTKTTIPGVKDLVLGGGKISDRGMKHGGMEVDGLIANNLDAYIHKLKDSEGSSAGWFLANVLMAGLTIDQDED